MRQNEQRRGGIEKEQRPQEGSEREGKVGEEGAGRGGVERRTSRWGEGPGDWETAHLIGREGRPGGERAGNMTQPGTWEPGGPPSHFTDEETEAQGGEAICEGQVLKRLISLLSVSLCISSPPFCLESVLIDRLVGSPTQMGLGSRIAQNSQVRFESHSRSGREDLKISALPSGRLPLSCKGMSRLAAVPPDEDPGEREAECELGCVQSLGPHSCASGC